MSGGFHFKGLGYVEWRSPSSGIDCMPRQHNAMSKVSVCTKDTKQKCSDANEPLWRASPPFFPTWQRSLNYYPNAEHAWVKAAPNVTRIFLTESCVLISAYGKYLKDKYIHKCLKWVFMFSKSTVHIKNLEELAEMQIPTPPLQKLYFIGPGRA